MFRTHITASGDYPFTDGAGGYLRLDQGGNRSIDFGLRDKVGGGGSLGGGLWVIQYDPGDGNWAPLEGLSTTDPVAPLVIGSARSIKFSAGGFRLHGTGATNPDFWLDYNEGG